MHVWNAIFGKTMGKAWYNGIENGIFRLSWLCRAGFNRRNLGVRRSVFKLALADDTRERKVMEQAF